MAATHPARPPSVRRKDALLLALGCFTLGCYFGSGLRWCDEPPPPPAAPPRSQFEERGPPSKQEMGQAGWTLLHAMAANFPEAPTQVQRERAEAFLHALGHLYPCPVCAAHFRQFYEKRPIASSSRTALSMWLCAAHNEVNLRNGKEEYFCDLGVLDARWKDCGCGGNKTMTSQRAHNEEVTQDGDGAGDQGVIHPVSESKGAAGKLPGGRRRRGHRRREF
jgi:hypothetical protein